MATSQPTSGKDHAIAMDNALALVAATSRAASEAPASSADLRALASFLDQASTAILDAYDLRRDPIAAIRDGMQACDDAALQIVRAAAVDEGFAGVEDWVKSARDWLQVPERYFANSRELPTSATPILASEGSLCLHRIERPTLAPQTTVATPLPRPEEQRSLAEELALLPAKERMAELRVRTKAMREAAAHRRDEAQRARTEARNTHKREDAPPEPGFAPGAHEPLSHDAFIIAKARELFEDIAVSGLHRTPQLGDGWRAVEPFERRLLRDIDAMAALGPTALKAVESLVTKGPSKDPTRAFAAAMILGCFEGRDGVALVERVLRYLGAADLDVQQAASAALKIVPHPLLPTVLRAWLRDREDGLRAIAIEVLSHRGLATPDELSAACRDSSEVVAARAFIPAALSNIEDLDTLLEERGAAKSAALSEALAWATALGSRSHAADRLRDRLEAGQSSAAIPLALVAEQSDAEDLLARFDRAPTRALAAALGYAGRAEALPRLVRTLDEGGAPELEQEVAFALQRITGAELFEEVDVPPEVVQLEDPPDPSFPIDKDTPPLRRLSSDRRDRPGEGAADRMSLPTTRPEPWRALLETENVRFQGDRRLRRGQPYTPLLSFQELDTFRVTPEERRILYREIVIKSGRATPFDPCDLLQVQTEAAKKLGAIAEKASSVPGAWGRAPRRT